MVLRGKSTGLFKQRALIIPPAFYQTQCEAVGSKAPISIFESQCFYSNEKSI